MCRKVIFLTCLVAVLGVVDGAWGALWTNGAVGDDSWCNDENWEPIGVPGPFTEVDINCTADRGPVIDCDVECGRIEGPAYEANCVQVMDVLNSVVKTNGMWRSVQGANARATTNMIDSDVTVNGDWRWADSSGSYGIVNVIGGSVTCPRLKIGDDGGGELNISGGAIVTVDGELDLSGDAKTIVTVDGGLLKVTLDLDPGSNLIEINLDEGTIECAEFSFGTAYVDINDGTFIIDGNVVPAVKTDITAGLITAYDGAPESEVHVAWLAEPNITVVTATTTYTWARHPNPEDRARDLCPDDVELHWTPGVYADKHDVYLGTDHNDVRDAITVSSEYIGRYEANSYDAGTLESLEPGVTYYWRIDEVKVGHADSPWKGKKVWQFTTNDGNAFDPYPVNKQTTVPLDETLSWSAGCFAVSHDVYFGTDYDEVKDAVTGSGVYKGNQALGETSYDPCDFDYLTVYYWRIDEVGSSETWKGEVWQFRSQSSIVDVNMVVWYKFDEIEGMTASDSSGYEKPAAVVGAADADWDPNGGHFDGCFHFTSEEVLAVPSDTLSSLSTAVTVALWVNDEPDSTDEIIAFDAGDIGAGGSNKVICMVPDNQSDVYWRAGDDACDVLVWEQATPSTWRGSWHHFAFVKDEIADTMSIYFDGFVVDSKTDVHDTLSEVKNKPINIGAYNNDQGSDHEAGLDDFRVYNRALSKSEIAGLFRGGDVALAWAPSPSDGEQDVPRDANLAWRPGDYAVSHDVYFGTDWDDVNNANTLLPVGTSVYKGRQDPCMYDPPGFLELGTTWYWRIDEVNDADGNSPWKGNIWRFTVASFLLVDDMESYNQTDNWISDTWLDGFENSTGAEAYVGVEPINPAHGGSQSMMYLYFNDGGIWDDLHYYSEVEVDTSMLPIGPDWTEVGVKALTLFFDGNSTNDANEQMYAGLEDTGGTYAQVDYGYYADEDMNDIKEDEWHEWNIALSDFTGVDANNVKKLYVGFGIRGNLNPGGTPGGSGFVYFDDVRLYVSRCIPWRLKPACDFTGDCKVDIADVGRMAESWLKIDRFVDVVEEPNTAVVHYEFNETSGSTAEDSSNDYDGVVKVDDVNTTEAFWESDGRFGGCIRFEHQKKQYCVEMPNDVFTHIANQITISLWVNWDDPYTMPDETNQLFSIHGGPGTAYEGILGIKTQWTEGELTFWDASKDVDYEPGEDGWSGGWNHYAFVKHVTDVNAGYLRVYHNSELAEKSDSNEPMDFPADNAWIGVATDEPNDWHDQYTGLLDDFRVYDYALSEAEIGWLASAGTGYVPLLSVVNIYDEEDAGEKAVNFRDLAELMYSWGEEKLWPVE